MASNTVENKYVYKWALKVESDSPVSRRLNGSSFHAVVIRISFRLFPNKVQVPGPLPCKHTPAETITRGANLALSINSRLGETSTFSASRPHSVMFSADRWVDVKHLFLCKKRPACMPSLTVNAADVWTLERSLEINALKTEVVPFTQTFVIFVALFLLKNP